MGHFVLLVTLLNGMKTNYLSVNIIVYQISHLYPTFTRLDRGFAGFH